ncbi:MAG: IcmT/TraK family protein [Alphaproteobacteria bacterium]|nr:IcmT/TraK family protein [Alphaproteobacteria bacterium]
MVREIENIQDKINWHWRNTMQPVRFFGFDARAALPLPLLLVYVRWSTILLTILTLIVFRQLERRGMTFPSAMRNLRSWIIGKDRPGWYLFQRKRFRDFG